VHTDRNPPARAERDAMAHDHRPASDDLAVELEQLVHEERQLSSVRHRLHDQIDNGFPNEVIVRREREISAQRRALHRRIDVLRLHLGLSPHPAA
jgi:hypothetical protein